MASKTHKASNGRAGAASARTTTTPADATPEAVLGFSQDQLQAVIGLTDVLFKGAEEMRRFQMEAAQQAREQHEKVQALVSQARTPAALFDAQSELLRYDMEAAGRYWQQMASICAATQADAMNLISRSAATVGNDVAKLVSQPLPQMLPQMAARAAPPAVEVPVSSEASTQAWNQWVDLGKQWTDMLYRTEAALH